MHSSSTEKKGIKNVIPLFISVDPKRDTVGQMKHYSQDFHPSIVYLTGTPDQVAKATKAYRVYFSKVRSFYPASMILLAFIVFCVGAGVELN